MDDELCPHCGKAGCLWQKQHREAEMCHYCKLALTELWKQKAAESAQAMRDKLDRPAREFWERAALTLATGSRVLPFELIAISADELTAEWHKRFDPKEGA